jgi:hypothetical protein
LSLGEPGVVDGSAEGFAEVEEGVCMARRRLGSVTVGCAGVGVAGGVGASVWESSWESAATGSTSASAVFVTGCVWAIFMPLTGLRADVRMPEIAISPAGAGMGEASIFGLAAASRRAVAGCPARTTVFALRNSCMPAAPEFAAVAGALDAAEGQARVATPRAR